MGGGAGRKAVLFLRFLAGIATALIFQLIVQRYWTRGLNIIDPFLILSAYYGMRYGPTRGMSAGAVSGLAQDAAFGAIMGVNGFSKTVVGYAAGFLAGRFVVRGPVSRVFIFASAVIVHDLCLLSLGMILSTGTAPFRIDLFLLKIAATSAAALFVLRTVWRDKIA